MKPTIHTTKHHAASPLQPQKPRFSCEFAVSVRWLQLPLSTRFPPRSASADRPPWVGLRTVITRSGTPVFSKPASNRGLPNRPSAPKLDGIGSHVLTSGRASCAYLSCTPRHGDRLHRGQHPPLPYVNCCRFDSCCNGRHGVQRIYGRLVRPRECRKRRYCLPIQVIQHGLRAPTRSTPRYGRSVAGLRNCTRSARYAEATTATHQARLVTRTTVLAGGEPNMFRIAARFTFSGYFTAASAIDNASRAPSSSARQQISSHSPTA